MFSLFNDSSVLNERNAPVERINSFRLAAAIVVILVVEEEEEEVV